MPSLTLLLEKVLLKTRHRPVRFSGDRLGTAVYRMRKPAAVLLVSAVLCGAFFSLQNEFRFTEPGASVRTEAGQVSELFGSSNPLVLLLPGDESDESYDTQRGLVRDLASLRRADGSPVVRDITAMVTTGAAALKEYSAADVAEMTGMNPAAVSLFFLVNGFGNSVRADRLLAAADSVAGAIRRLQSCKSSWQPPEACLSGIITTGSSWNLPFLQQTGISAPVWILCSQLRNGFMGTATT